jgi:hypothetical protein
MNQVQQAIARFTGVDGALNELQSQYEQTSSDNALLLRQIEDIDYLNLFDINAVVDIIPVGDRKKHYNKLRRLRQENPLAKQAVKLILRFTLGKGVQISIGPDPAKELEKAQDVALPPDDAAALNGNGNGAHKLNGLYPGNKPTSNLKPLPRARKQVGEAAEDPESDDQLKEIVEDFWKDRENQAALTSPEAMKEWLDRVVTDGECFYVAFTAEASPYVKLTYIMVEEVTDIVYDPDNWMIPIYYKRTYQPQKYNGKNGYYEPDGKPKDIYYLDFEVTDEDLMRIGNRISIPGDKRADENARIVHHMINPLWTKKGKRGISELYASREWFRVYKEFMEDRAAINAAATSIAYKRKIKGGPTAVAQFQGKFGGLDVGYDNPNNTTEVRRLTRPTPAATYDSNPAVDLEWMKTDTGAANAKEDGRSLLGAAGAGVGFFIHYFGEGGDANLATAQSMELPMVKTFEDWQEWVDTSLLRLLKYVITIATDEENANTQIDRVSGIFPPLISQDVVKYTTAWSQVSQNIAPGNKIVHHEAIRGALTVMNVPNVDALMARVEAEEKALEIQREQQRQEMLQVMKEQPNPIMDGNGNPGDPNLRRIASGKPEPERNGPKPPR